MSITNYARNFPLPPKVKFTNNVYKNSSFPSYRRVSKFPILIQTGKWMYAGFKFPVHSWAIVPLNPKQFKTLVFNESIDYYGILKVMHIDGRQFTNAKHSFRMVIVKRHAWNSYTTEFGKNIQNIQRLLKNKLPCVINQTLHLAKSNKLVDPKHAQSLFLAPLPNSKERKIIEKIFGNKYIVNSV